MGSPDAENKKNRGIDVLALWYQFEGNGVMQQLQKNHSFYTNIENYIATVSDPSFKSTSSNILCFENKFLETIRKDLSKLECKRK